MNFTARSYMYVYVCVCMYMYVYVCVGLITLLPLKRRARS